MFVFRNNTIERFFPNGYLFSGYDDVSFIPEDAEAYVWFYQAPIKFDNGLCEDEINAFLQKFRFIVDKAVEYKLGARGLRSIVECIMMEAMFEVPSKKVKTFEVTEDYAKEQLEKSNTLG